jgi:hypothetical protein
MVLMGLVLSGTGCIIPVHDGDGDHWHHDHDWDHDYHDWH